VNWSRTWAGRAVLLSVIGCSASAENETSGGGPAAKPPTCEDYKAAICGYSELCYGNSDCDERLKNLTCIASAPISRCIDLVERSTCDNFPLGCEPLDVADVTDVHSKCKQLESAYCGFYVRCGLFDNQAECTGLLGCDVVVAITDTYDACLPTPAVRACGSDIPPQCVGVLQTW
jgi:hypothetical protein